MNAGAVFSLNYHVVFCPKFRRPVLADPRDTRPREIFRNVAGEHGITLHAMAVMPDHVRRLVDAEPTLCVAEIVHRLKGASSRILRGEFPHPRRRLPAPSLLSVSPGESRPL